MRNKMYNQNYIIFPINHVNTAQLFSIFNSVNKHIPCPDRINNKYIKDIYSRVRGESPLNNSVVP